VKDASASEPEYRPRWGIILAREKASQKKDDVMQRAADIEDRQVAVLIHMWEQKPEADTAAE
jgi:hypothetical protein